ncbi:MULTISPECIES: acyl-homoserine-lactone synthase [Acetobacteraceae]|uniref:acyl-homoserine-lactone synthase n=1 Tax=Acetobacteraceae TaxID=433 RepID=UPI000C861ABF|nr:acyl-homoserine-lactone synthase [Komagataeibacter saccharivorans]
MIKVFSYNNRNMHIDSYEKMLRARALVFGERMKWDVQIADGKEEDEYDRKHNPLYFIVERPDGTHATSMRIIPTTGPTMLRDKFHKFFPECPDIYSSTIWESTRYCATLTAGEIHYTAELARNLCQTCLENGITHLTGIFFHPMQRIYERAGWPPEPIMSARLDGKMITLATFDVSQARLDEINKKFTLAA